MFGRMVEVDGQRIFITCSPTTPYSEICLRAAKHFKILEEQENKARATALADARERAHQ
jgi:hypothetical protein